MAKLTAEQFADKQARRLKAATEDIRIGIENVTESPMKKAVAKQDKMRANLIKSIDSGKWAQRTGAVTLETWKSAVLEKGIARIPAGIDRARDKVIAFASELLPFQDALKVKIEKMPDVTLEDNLNRMVEFARGMANFKRRG